MEEPTGTGRDWSKTLSDATKHVKEHERAVAEATGVRESAWRGPVLAAAAVILVGVLGLDAYVLMRPPEILSPAEQAVDLRWFVADAVEVVEDFRAANGRLPAPADMADLIEDGFSYEVRGEGYVIGLEGDGVAVQYDGSVPLDEWVQSEAADTPGGTP